MSKKTFFHTLDKDEALTKKNSSSKGLNKSEAENRLSQYGENKIEHQQRRTILNMFIDQFKDIMIVILIVAALISGFLGEMTDTIVISVVVLLNSILGVFQENKAENALQSLKEMSPNYAKVKREGEVKEIVSNKIVPGDIVILEMGDYVPADMRLIDTQNLEITEAALTGESVPVGKKTELIEEKDIVIGDRTNMAYMGSNVTYGQIGRAHV